MSQGQARATVKISSSLRALPSGCFDPISLTLREYEHVRAEGTGDEGPAGERTI
jgi:hypothetical protein